MSERVGSNYVPWKLQIAIPDYDFNLNSLLDRDIGCRWYKMPDDVYEHKEYPICKCGRKYVPVDKHKACYFCVFLNK